MTAEALLAPGFPERAAIGGVALRILRDGLCPGPDCRVQALVYSSSPLVQGRAGRIDAQMVARFLMAAQGLGGSVLGRKRVVEGKSVSVRVVFGCRSDNQKKKTTS